MSDVTILGGGLAGLTLALQLKQRRPETSVLVLEKRPHPVPAAAHKVGESSVEVGAHYFAEVLGLREHIERDQLPKYGLRFFMRSAPGQPIEDGLEVGPSKWPVTPSYQLDRGIFENHLAKEAEALGVEFVDQCRVTDVDLRRRGAHMVRYTRHGQDTEVSSRWVVDAAGRPGFLKRRLGLAADVGHKANAGWFRVSTRIDVDDFSDDPAWKERGRTDGPRYLSTNHLMGRGYWVWLIPLSSGSTSVGVVADGDLHPLSGFNSFDKAMAWLHRNEPECAGAIEQAVAAGAEVQDFLAMKQYAHGCTNVFSGDRWALTGDAGVFLDPFYSPGSDFIGMSNTYITDLACRDLAGERVRELASFYESLYFSFFRNGLSVYEGMYPVWGNARVMPIKVAWDYVFYWGVFCLLFFNGKLTDLEAIVRVRSSLERAVALNLRMQRFFRDWDAVDRRAAPAGFFDQSSHESMIELNRVLQERFDGDAFVERLHHHVALLEEMAEEIVARAAATAPTAAAGWDRPVAAPATEHLGAAFASIGG